ARRRLLLGKPPTFTLFLLPFSSSIVLLFLWLFGTNPIGFLLLLYCGVGSGGVGVRCLRWLAEAGEGGGVSWRWWWLCSPRRLGLCL
ncbi:hypothetical protein Tsubulata_009708, partial [Turnera subulata]